MYPIFAENETKVQYEIKITGGEDQLFHSRRHIEIWEQESLYAEIVTKPQEPSVHFRLHCELRLSISQINRIRHAWHLARKPGRPRKAQTSKAVGQVKTMLPQAGVSLLACWLEETGRLTAVFEKLYKMIHHYRCEHPEEEFRLRHARRETVEYKWLALQLLPLLGIKKLSEIDYKAPNLAAVIGRHYGSSTLTQYLGELERVGAAEIKTELAVEASGRFCYLDGHMSPLWTTVKMHKGKMTMLGRVMAGTKTVVTHTENGQAIDFACYPPDFHLSKVVEERCAAIQAQTGRNWFIIDREVNAVETARRFDQLDWGLISLLDANEYKGNESFRRHPAGHLEDGTALYWATWKPARADDPRQFVLVDEEQGPVAYWCTHKLAKKFTAGQIVTYYRQRVDIQENGFKHLIAYCALDTNFGIKKIWGPDRMQARDLEALQSQQAKLQVKEQNVQQKIAAQNQKIQDSQAKGHEGLLSKRQAKLMQYQVKQQEIERKLTAVAAQKQKLGEPKQRADRDLRKQSIMTFRSLWLYNTIRTFFALISAFLSDPLDIGIGIELFLFRPGFLVETDSKLLYCLDDKNLSPKYQEILRQLVAGFNSISLVRRGKRLQVAIASPP